MRAGWAVLSLIAFIEPAAAAHCGHGRIYRVSMGVCVGAHSRLAREVEIVARRIERPRPPVYYVDVSVPAQRAAEPPPPPPDPGVEIPYSLPYSRMWNPPARFTPWVLP